MAGDLSARVSARTAGADGGAMGRVGRIGLGQRSIRGCVAWRRRDRAHLAVHQVSAPAHCLDDVLGRPQRTADLYQALHQGVLGHGRVRPDGVQHFLLWNHPAGVRQEISQHAEAARTQPHFFAAIQDDLAPEVQLDVQERQPHGRGIRRFGRVRHHVGENSPFRRGPVGTTAGAGA